MSKERLTALIEASEVPMLAAALVAVAIYLGGLAGAWEALGVSSAAFGLAVALDALFVVDLLLKIGVLGTSYLAGPWFLVDLLCALPLLATLSMAPSVIQGLRSVRMFRLLRALRVLRVLRSLRILKFLATQREDTRENQVYHQVLRGAVLLYSALFVGLVLWVRDAGPPGEVVAVGGVPLGDRVEVEVRESDGTLRTLVLPRGALFAEADRAELLLATGALLGMLLILVVARFQIPALWSRQISALLNVALPEQVARVLLAHPERYEDNVRMPATVIFCDIKGFTSTVERLSLEELKKHLEAALDAVVEAHRAHDLIIDKFIGDAVMSFRGGNIAGGDPGEIAYHVVRAALDGAKALRALDDPYFSEIKIGGASASDVLIGAFGTSRRLSYTVLGDRVNLAARLEASCNALGVSNLFCDTTRTLTADRADLVWRRVGSIRVQGKDEVTVAWQAFEAGPGLDWIARYHRAYEDFAAGRVAEAAVGFAAVDVESGGDGPSRLLRARCEELLVQGMPADWKPVLETRK